MMQYSPCYQLKDKAKNMLRGKYTAAMSVCTMSVMLSVAANLFVTGNITPLLSRISGTMDVFSPMALLLPFSLSELVSFLLAAVLGILQLGTALFFLNMACNQPYSLQNLFYGFRQDTGRAITISALQALVELICLIPFRFFLKCFTCSGSTDWLMPAMVAMAVGYCIYIPISLSLYLSFYLMLDFPDKSAVDILKLSIRTMKGHKKRLFLLEISFIPLMILCVCALYIGFLWLMPYMQMTYVYFFLDVMNPENNR
ncbi:MAG: DUF975 family protein [Acetatifactor sp.]